MNDVITPLSALVAALGARGETVSCAVNNRTTPSNPIEGLRFELELRAFVRELDGYNFAGLPHPLLPAGYILGVGEAGPGAWAFYDAIPF